MDIDSENKWAVYPIEKIEAAMRELSEAIVMARAAQREANEKKRQMRAEIEQARRNEQALDKILCPGCRDGLYKDAGDLHIYMDGDNSEPCYATAERKQQLRDYFEKDITLGRGK